MGAVESYHYNWIKVSKRGLNLDVGRTSAPQTLVALLDHWQFDNHSSQFGHHVTAALTSFLKSE